MTDPFDLAGAVLAAVFNRAIEVLSFPFDPANRLFWLYLLSSTVFAWFVYRAVRARGRHATEADAEAASGTFLQFLFPKRVWSHPSAWLDLRYVFFHKVVSHFLLLGLAAFSLSLGYWIASGGQPLAEIVDQDKLTTAGDWGIAIAFMVLVFVVIDFVSWAIHYLQHRIPVLWQFHKVHHSAEVMHPVSNFREHPVDNLAYGFFTGLCSGIAFGLGVRWLGYRPTAPLVLGVPALAFLFNFVAYNLRHSHVWLRWPGKWSAVFPSPAHHHVHHSCHPDHIDKNFAFMFPVWDVIFGTYIMPEDNRDVRFGVTKNDGDDLDGVLRLYWVPFRDAGRILARDFRRWRGLRGRAVDQRSRRNNS